jgi:hypothetical protein
VFNSFQLDALLMESWSLEKKMVITTRVHISNERNFVGTGDATANLKLLPPFFK